MHEPPLSAAKQTGQFDGLIGVVATERIYRRHSAESRGQASMSR